jgi:prepilin-type N-terminal cleavage/methylation domain-containing protein
MTSPRARRQSGLTLIELLVAVVICLILALASTYGFIEALKARDRAQARLEATANGRHALDTIGLELKRARLFPTTLAPGTTTPLYLVPFSAQRLDLPLGDRIDNDENGLIDEEVSLDGVDDNGDWQVGSDDIHAIIPAVGGGFTFERPFYVTSPDLGDARVDIDTRLASTELQFETFPVAGGPPRRAVRFFLADNPDDPQGQPTTLFRTVFDFEPATGIETSSTGILATNVASFAALYYDVTVPPPFNPWVREWNSDLRLPQRNIYPEIPVSVYLRLQVFSGTPRSLNEIGNDERLPTVSLSTMVNVEAVLADPRITSIKPVTNPIIP